MKYRILGKSQLKVSELCFGTLVISPLQANLSQQDGQKLLEFAYDQGITFFDTAELYQSYTYFKSMPSSKKKSMIIASKSYASEYDEMMKVIHNGLSEIRRDYFDIFKLHEQESVLTLKGHQGAINALKDAKKQGKIRAIGISTHSVKLCQQLLLHPEFDVIHPLFNYKAHGYMHGNLKEQEENLKQLYLADFGIYVMKPFGGGRFSFSFQKAFSYVRDFPFRHSIAIGMKNTEEIIVNIALLENTFIPGMEDMLHLSEKKLFYRKTLCAQCYQCVQACRFGVIHQNKDGGIVIDHDRCVLCGYCLSQCPHLALRLL